MKGTPNPWTLLMDIITVIWAGSVITALGWHELAEPAERLATGLLIFFALDFMIVYSRIRDFRKFIRKEWPAMFLIFPWFRIFRVVGLIRLLGIAELSRASRTLRLLENEAYYKMKDIGEMTRNVYKKQKKK